MLVTMISQLEKAQKGGYAVIAANVCDELTTVAAIEAAEECNSPLILNVPYGAVHNFVEYGRMAEARAQKSSVPVSINLDHGQDFFESVMSVAAGFTSMMADRSMLPYEENVAQVAELAKIAHAARMTLVAEHGHVGEAAEPNADTDIFTDPEQAADFVAATGCDCLAVAIGTAHGAYPEGRTPTIDFDRLEAIAAKVSVPLVLHGGSGSGDEALAKCARGAICKINIATALQVAGYEAIRGLEGDDVFFAQEKFLQAFKAEVKRHMELFGSVGKA